MVRRLAALALVVLLAGCSATHATNGRSPSTAGSSPDMAGAWSLVALGDSVPAGTGCDCTPYPELSASELSPSGGPEVAVTNDAVAGFTTSDVLEQLDTASEVVLDDIRAADLIELQVGANDVAYSTTCGPDAACYLPEVPAIEANLRAIVARLHELASHPVGVVLLDYWSVWLGGQYAAQQGPAYVAAADTVTGQVNAAVRDVASRTPSAYVDLKAAFKGPDYAYDETTYLAPDGDHPNAAGHQQIAAALVSVVTKETHVPPP
jgi:lysophospholipase L1-like esterase